jgi:hypothetical protein
VKNFTSFLMEKRVEAVLMHKELATNSTIKALKLCVTYEKEDKLCERAFQLDRIIFYPLLKFHVPTENNSNFTV